MSLDPALRSRIDTLLQSNRVVLFMKGQPGMPQCGFSAKAIGVLDGLGIDYAHVNVLADQEIREGIKAYGDWPTIPQLYVDGELIGGSDIIVQMADSGELSSMLGLQAPDRSPPKITITPAAVEMLKGALADAPDASLTLAIDANFQPNFQLASTNPNDIRGRGLAIDNPNAPKPVQELAVRDADDRLKAGTLTVVDVRPADERALATVAAPFRTLDAHERLEIEQLPKDTPLAFLCHRGGRSLQAAEHFRGLGFTNVYNVTGGIDAWSDAVDNGVPKY